ncbi:hypothetical protein PHJA_000549100 [Phtheirospermum japonicum]|uniref:Bifunctional inhibitor/plant lipid transfer protein/seed storage helical domain-containing protein n=1 Tax=Phtheirospermum japonicum TaxID=374723 RepID=A0A830BJE2_9LAMI|nr:hypothetical protein PHJA_000549100 [Phtheirospermum japonicum]
MAHQEASLGLALILAAMLWAGAAAQSDDCSSVLVSLSPCINYISGNSSDPSAACCTQLSSVVGTQPQCLCQVLNGGSSNIGLNINQTQALALPGACNVQTPPTSQCNAASPSGSPGSTTPNSPNTNLGGGSEFMPPNGDGTSDANSTKLGVSVLFFLVSVASYVTNFVMA